MAFSILERGQGSSAQASKVQPGKHSRCAFLNLSFFCNLAKLYTNMANIPANQDRRELIIKTLKRHGPMTLSQLSAKLDIGQKAMQSVCRHMKAEGILTSYSERPAIYDVVSTKWQGPKADPRSKSMEGQFTGVDWSVSTSRPGCLDHTQHPSRRGDELVPYQARMIHMSSTVSPFASINTKERAL